MPARANASSKIGKQARTLSRAWSQLASIRRCSMDRSSFSVIVTCCPLMALTVLLLMLRQKPSIQAMVWGSAAGGLTSSTPSPQPSEAQLLARIRNGSVRCSDIQSVFPGRIPPVVHWTNFDDKVLVPHQEMLRSWLRVLGDSVAYMYWEDKDVEQLVSRHYPGLWKQWQNIHSGIARSDIGRLTIVHHVGGVYTDLDVQLLRSLHPLVHNYTALWSQELKEHIYFIYRRSQLLSNAIFMSRARHQFLDYVIASWPGWFQEHWFKRRHELNSKPSSAVYATGPMMLNHFLDQYRSRASNGSSSSSSSSNALVLLTSPDLFHPTWDPLYGPGFSRSGCSAGKVGLPRDRQVLRDLLAGRQFIGHPVPAESVSVHKFMHTGYVRATGSMASGDKLVDQILPLSRCVI